MTPPVRAAGGHPSRSAPGRGRLSPVAGRRREDAEERRAASPRARAAATEEPERGEPRRRRPRVSRPPRAGCRLRPGGENEAPTAPAERLRGRGGRGRSASPGSPDPAPARAGRPGNPRRRPSRFPPAAATTDRSRSYPAVSRRLPSRGRSGAAAANRASDLRRRTGLPIFGDGQGRRPMTAPGRVARGRPARAPGDSRTDPAGGNGASPVAGTPFAAKPPHRRETPRCRETSCRRETPRCREASCRRETPRPRETSPAAAKSQAAGNLRSRRNPRRLHDRSRG